MPDSSGYNRRDASESIWYVLATIAGELASVQDLNRTAQQNRHFWNGLMAPRIATYGGMVESRLGYHLDLPKLTDSDNQKIRTALNTRGFAGVPIPKVNTPIDFSNTVFARYTAFLGFVFGGEVRFENVKFLDGPLMLQDVTFAGNANFDGAIFYTETVSMKTTFAGSVSFKNTEFLHDVYLSGARFLSETKFVNTRFSSAVHFNAAEFEHGADFTNSVFEGNLDFESAEFKGPTRFDEASFETKVPSFFEATLHEYTDWHNTRWPGVPNDTNEAREQLQRYQRRALLMNKLEKPDDRHTFFRKEMRARRRAERPSIASVMNWLYEFICDYGHGLARIFSFWFGQVVAGALVMWATNVFRSSQSKLSDQGASEIIGDFFEALAISFSNSHVFLVPFDG